MYLSIAISFPRSPPGAPCLLGHRVPCTRCVAALRLQVKGGNNPDWWPLNNDHAAALPDELLHSPESSHATIAVYAWGLASDAGYPPAAAAPDAALQQGSLLQHRPEAPHSVSSENLHAALPDGPQLGGVSQPSAPVPHGEPVAGSASAQGSSSGCATPVGLSPRGSPPTASPSASAAGQSMLPPPGKAPSAFARTPTKQGNAAHGVAPWRSPRSAHLAKPGVAGSDTGTSVRGGMATTGSEGGSDYEDASSESEGSGAASPADLRAARTPLHAHSPRSALDGAFESAARQQSRGMAPLLPPASGWQPPSSFQGGAMVMSARVDLNDLQYVGES